MDISGSRFLVAGGTGFLGQKFARALLDGGATVAITGRDNAELSRVSAELNCPAIPLDYTDPGSVRAAASAVVHELGGLDGLLIATGAVAFGPVGEIGNEIETGLMRINATGPMELVSVLLDELAPGGAVVAVTAVVAEFPTAGMAAYSASKLSSSRPRRNQPESATREWAASSAGRSSSVAALRSRKGMGMSDER